ncbi:MAG: hypothetical protein U0U70_10760 [Chitinophagaceae bacterium]
MKKSLFLIVAVCLVVAVQAQSYESIKTMVTLQQYQKAKEDLDKNFSNAKFTSKPEAYMLKAAIYSALAVDNANKNPAEGEKLAKDADAAFIKFKEMDPSMGLLSDAVYQNCPVNIYSAFYSMGYGDYTKKNWQAGFEKFNKAVEYSDLVINKKIVTVTLDTNVLILAALVAENSKNPDYAAKYYGRLADAHIGGEDYEGIYRFLVNYYFGKKDMANFEKYKAIGAELYPKSEYFTYDKVDFAVGLVNSFEEKLKAIDEVLSSDPNNFKANQVLGELIYDTLNPSKEGTPLPSNAAELETKMVNAFTKAVAAKPGYEISYLFIGDHFINKAVKINDARSAHAADMKARTKPGTMASKEDIAKRDLLDKQYGDALESAREPYEKAAEIFAAKGTLTLKDKQQYKKACNYLADIYSFKKIQAKAKPADQAKFAAEEKKWNERYDSIK